MHFCLHAVNSGVVVDPVWLWIVGSSRENELPSRERYKNNRLVKFDGVVNFENEEEGREKADGAAEEEESKGKNSHRSEI